MKIIVADDEATNRLLLVLMLRRLGHEVRSVTDGAELLLECNADGADLLLIDVHMPVLDGVEAARAIVRTMGSVGRPILIAMTANDDRRVRQICIAAGMDDLLLKPVTLSALREALSHWPTRTVDPRVVTTAA